MVLYLRLISGEDFVIETSSADITEDLTIDASKMHRVFFKYVNDYDTQKEITDSGAEIKKFRAVEYSFGPMNYDPFYFDKVTVIKNNISYYCTLKEDSGLLAVYQKYKGEFNV